MLRTTGRRGLQIGNLRSCWLLSAAALAMLPKWAQAGALQDAASSMSLDGEAEAVGAPGDIIVTAQRRSERLQDVPVTVSAFDSARLDRLNVRGSTEIDKLTPGVSFVNSGTTPQITIRGVGTRGLSGGDESSVAIYVDGAYQPYLTNAFMKFNSVERIEVLKGPQSTLYGRNATAGAMTIVTRDPPEGLAAKVSASYGRFNEVLARAYVGVGSEKVRGDISAVFYDTDGYSRDISTNTRRGGRRDVSVRAKLQLLPTDDIKLTFTYMHADSNDNQSGLGRALNGNTIAIRWPGAPQLPTGFYDISAGRDTFLKVNTDNAMVNAQIDLGGVSATIISSYMSNTVFSLNNDQRGLDVPIFGADIKSYPESFYNEAYIRSDGSSRFNWLIGAVYFTDKTPYGTYDLITWSPATNRYTHLSHHNEVGTHSAAGYAQVDFAVSDALKLIAGGRYTSETKYFNIRDYQSGFSANLSGGFLAPVPAPVNISASRHFTNFSPSATLQYRPSADVNLYAKFATGYKSGIYSAASNRPVPAEPEKIKQYEVGLKLRPAPWISIAMAGYFSDYRNLQATSRDPVTLATVLQNAASAHIKGAEFEFTANPTPELQIYGGAALTDAKYTRFPGAQVTFPLTTVDPSATDCRTGTGTRLGGNRTAFCDAAGTRVLRVPKYTATFGLDYTWTLQSGQINIAASSQYQSEMYWQPLDRLREPGRVLVDGSVSWTSEDKRYKATLWVDNLTNRKYLQGVSTSATSDFGYPAPPRTFGIELAYNFN